MPGRGTATGRVLLTGKAVQIADVEADPEYTFSEGQRAGGFRTVLAVPLEREGETIGVIVLCRTKVHPFTDKQIDLVQNFAAQAVIAIENARLLNELRQRTIDLTERTADLTEALEQQTATSEVLRVISSSPGDLEPVFQAMLENATRLRQTKGVSYTADYAAEGIPAPPVTLGGARSTVDVPMLKDNELVGAFSIYRQEVRPFTEKQIELVKNFAAQAVIAVENARLLKELRQRTTDLTERTDDLTEALEQQTATSEVLQVISSSPGDLQPVFATMLEKAVRLCDATFGNIYRWDGELSNLVASHNTPPALVEARKRLRIHFVPKDLVGQAIANKKAVHIADLADRADASRQSKHPEWLGELRRRSPALPANPPSRTAKPEGHEPVPLKRSVEDEDIVAFASPKVSDDVLDGRLNRITGEALIHFLTDPMYEFHGRCHRTEFARNCAVPPPPYRHT